MVGDNHASFHPSFLTTKHQTSTFTEHTTINQPFHECWPSRHGILVLISSACPSGVKNRVVHRSIQTTMKTCTNRLRWWNKSPEMIGPAITNCNNPTHQRKWDTVFAWKSSFFQLQISAPLFAKWHALSSSSIHPPTRQQRQTYWLGNENIRPSSYLGGLQQNISNDQSHLSEFQTGEVFN